MFFANILYSLNVTYKAARIFFILKVFLSFIEAFFPFVNVYIWRNIINFLTNIKDYDNINFLVVNIIAYMLFYILTQLFTRVSQYIGYKYNDKVNLFVESVMIDKFADVDLAFYDSSKLQNKLSRAWDIKNSIINIGDITFSLLRSFVIFITSLILLVKLSAFYVLIILILSIPVFIFKIRVNTMNNKFWENNGNNERKIGYYKSLFTDINSSFDIRLYNLKDFFVGKYVEEWREFNKKRKELTIKAIVFTFISLLISSFINQILLYALIIDKLTEKTIQIGDATYYMSVFSQFYNSTLNLVNCLSYTQYAFQRIITVKEFLDLEQIIQKNGTLEPKTFTEIRFSHVYFKYLENDNYILEDCTFTIKKGQMVGLVGENGSGKSTIVKLLLRLYDVDSGHIFLDGVDIKEYDIVKYRAMFSVLFQDFIQYRFTLRENIALSDHDNISDDKKINSAIDKSELREIVNSWEKDLETPLTRYFDSEGKELSGGQWQRVALARVFFSNRDFIVLDEPSASLDVFAEAKIFKQFEQLSNNRSSLIISHRLSSIVNANNIIVLKDGRVIEQGNHKELLNKNGYYAELFYLQASRYKKEENVV